MRGGWAASPAAARAIPAVMASMWGEWKARETLSCRVLRPWAAQCAAIAATASRSPETTTAAGPFTAARAARPSWPRRDPASSSGEAWIAAIAPLAGAACISRPRAATSVHASGRENTPARWAAASSPTEWPSRKSGRRPHDSSSRNSATSTANRAGWVNSVWSSAGPPAVIRSRRGSWSPKAAQTSSRARA